jgi:hypothetical protein
MNFILQKSSVRLPFCKKKIKKIIIIACYMKVHNVCSFKQITMFFFAQEYLEKTTELSQVTEKLIPLCSTPRPDRDSNSHQW